MPVENNTTNTNENSVDYEDFANKVLGDNEPASTEGEDEIKEIAGLEFEKLDAAVSEYTGGKIDSFKRVKDLLEKASVVEQLQNDMESWKQKAETNPFADDLAKTFNELRKNGASDNDIKLFMEMQYVDIDSMSKIDIIKKGLQKEKNLSKEAIESYMKSEYGGTTLEEIQEGDLKHRFEIDSQKYGSLLQELKVNSAEPESLRQKKAAEAQRMRLAQTWDGAMNALSKRGSKLSLGTLEDGTEISIDLTKEEQQGLYQQVVMQMANKGLPLTPENYNNHALPFLQQMVSSFKLKEVVQQAVAQRERELIKEHNLKIHNVEDRHTNKTPQSSNQKPPRQNDAWAAFRKKDFGS